MARYTYLAASTRNVERTIMTSCCCASAATEADRRPKARVRTVPSFIARASPPLIRNTTPCQQSTRLHQAPHGDRGPASLPSGPLPRRRGEGRNGLFLVTNYSPFQVLKERHVPEHHSGRFSIPCCRKRRGRYSIPPRSLTPRPTPAKLPPSSSTSALIVGERSMLRRLVTAV